MCIRDSKNSHEHLLLLLGHRFCLQRNVLLNRLLQHDFTIRFDLLDALYHRAHELIETRGVRFQRQLLLKEAHRYVLNAVQLCLSLIHI